MDMNFRHLVRSALCPPTWIRFGPTVSRRCRHPSPPYHPYRYLISLLSSLDVGPPRMNQGQPVVAPLHLSFIPIPDASVHRHLNF